MPTADPYAAPPIVLEANGLRFSAWEAGGGPLVLCLHGFPDHARSFRRQLPVLAAAGYRAVAPMLRGYEPSSQPKDADYHAVRLAEDAVGWLDALGAKRAHLVGHDWGAVAGYLAAALAPERFLSLTTLSVPHPGRFLREAALRRPSQLLNSWYILFFQLRGVADRRLARDDFAFVEKLWRDWSPGWAWPPDEMAALKQTLRQPGVARAVLGYYRAIADFFSAAGRATQRLQMAKIRVPTLALTGERDGCMDTRLHDDLMRAADFPAGVEVARVAGAGHFLHQEAPEAVNERLLAWLRRHTPAA